MGNTTSNLNSVLLEGVISGELSPFGEGDKQRCSFAVRSIHCESEGGTEKRETTVRVVFRGPKLVKAAQENAHDGRGLRIVGRIAGDMDFEVYIEAEHVEYRPEPKRRG